MKMRIQFDAVIKYTDNQNKTKTHNKTNTGLVIEYFGKGNITNTLKKELKEHLNNGGDFGAVHGITYKSPFRKAGHDCEVVDIINAKFV